MGYILLEGGAEFGGQMAAPDLRAMELAGGADALLSVIPAAAAADNNHQCAGQKAQRWFHQLGATNAAVLPLIDRPSAEDATLVNRLRQSRMIYMLGGFPQHLAQSLAGTRAWEAMRQAWSYLKEHGTSKGIEVPQYRGMHELMGFSEVWDFEKRWAS